MVEPGFTCTPVGLRSIAGIGAFRDRDRMLAALAAEFGVLVPTEPRMVQAGSIAFWCLAPTRFVASAERGHNLTARLSQILAGLAAITDQSDMWSTWLLSGAHCRDILARIVPIDLHPEVFRAGDIALTRGGHLDVRLCRTSEREYEISVTRSFALDLEYALESAVRGCA